ncbi:MAG: hypothetical protein U0165_02515 [Polyangiaceae bacterium]
MDRSQQQFLEEWNAYLQQMRPVRSHDCFKKPMEDVASSSRVTPLTRTRR